MTASKTSDPFGAESYGYTQQNTRCKILIYSHVTDNPYNGQIDCSLDVISCETSKTIKGGGQAVFLVVPRKNYLNLIFPNDYVNIYFDPGDGRGYIRTFFGFVDRINRTINTDAGTGATTTRFQVQCSDFTKAFVKTELYFNQRIAHRKDLKNEWQAGGNIGGVELMAKGVAMHGSPADIIMSLCHLLMGFNSQFILPESYPIPEGNLYANRKARQDWAKNRLSETIQKAIGQEEITAFESAIKSAAFSQAKLNTGSEPTSQAVQEAQSDILKSMGLPKGLFQTQEWRAAVNIAETTVKGAPRSLLDLIDFRHVEWKSIDGYVTSQSICRSEGSLWSLMNAWSNEMLNELFCDLRPMQSDATSGGSTSGGAKQDKELSSGGYGFEKDELGENTGAVRFAPALVMREYPFGTIEGIDPPEELLIMKKYLGLIYIGALFSKEPGIPGRKTVTIPAMHPTLLMKYKGSAKAIKHLDVAVISVQDIIQEQIGRGDSDHTNLLEVYSEVSAGGVLNSRFLTQVVQPIVSKINVVRHGLRVRTYQTKFARFSAEQKYVDVSSGFKDLGFTATEAEKLTTEFRLSGVDGVHNRRLIIRWALILDHYYQHNLEYLNGTISTRAFPEIRVGYRLDIQERHESYYVEGVNHSWTYPNALLTTFTVSRGQRWDPYPVYILPSSGFTGVRGKDSRLGEFFHVVDTSATDRALIAFGDARNMEEKLKSMIDIPKAQTWAKTKDGYLVADSTAPSDAVNKAKTKLVSKVVGALKSRTNKVNNLLSSPDKTVPTTAAEFDPNTLFGDDAGGKN